MIIIIIIIIIIYLINNCGHPDAWINRLSNIGSEAFYHSFLQSYMYIVKSLVYDLLKFKLDTPSEVLVVFAFKRIDSLLTVKWP